MKCPISKGAKCKNIEFLKSEKNVQLPICDSWRVKVNKKVKFPTKNIKWLKIMGKISKVGKNFKKYDREVKMLAHQQMTQVQT